MANLEMAHDIYRERLEVDACYKEFSDAVQSNMADQARTYGLHPIERVAHGVLAFCKDKEDGAVCLPWLVDPDAPAKYISGGRHGLVMQEFYFLANSYDLRSSTQRDSHSKVGYDDFLSTYVVRNNQNTTPYTVICDSLEGPLASTENIALLEGISSVHNDHQFVVKFVGATDTKYLNISQGTITEIPYGFPRSMRIETVAAPDDILGRTRELENYSLFAERHGLEMSEFLILTDKAVQAFNDHRQVDLDTLCLEIIAERKKDEAHPNSP